MQNNKLNSSLIKAPSVIVSNGEIFRYSSKHERKRDIKRKVDKIKKEGYRVRNKYLNINGRKMYVIYQGRRCGKTVRKNRKRKRR